MQRKQNRLFVAAHLATVVIAVGVAAPELSAQALPADGEAAAARLSASPRHGEWVQYDAGGGDSVLAWLVYPERSDNAPVVVVIHEIFGMSDWIRGVADQLAAEGYIAIAPDLLSGKGPNGGGTESLGDDVRRAIRELDPAEVGRRLQAGAEYAMALPAAKPVAASMGFCWGGTTSFAFATQWADLRAAVVYYGTSPEREALGRINAAVLGLYGGDDARVNATIEAAQEEMRRLGKRYEVHIFEGAGHGFLRQQQGRDGANMRATEQAWARSLEFLREVLGR